MNTRTLLQELVSLRLALSLYDACQSVYRGSLHFLLFADLQEITDLKQALTKEVDELRSEFSDLKAALKQQIEIMNSVQAATDLTAK